MLEWKGVEMKGSIALLLCFHERLLGASGEEFVGSVIYVAVSCSPREKDRKLRITGETWTDCKDYLIKYGYLKEQDPRTGALRSEDSFINALKQFQKMASLPVTGKLDNATQTMMRMPRCGNKDNIELGLGARRKRYALQGSKWAKRDLTFKISEYPRGISRDMAEKEVHKALKVWGDVTPLNFILRPYDERVDIDVKFTRRNHGDGNPFDGRGQTLAHAFFPQYGGDAHFDDDEDWTINLSSGINVFQVAAHEFGHSLGLSHSDVSTALMAPFYRGYQKRFQLDQDDTNAIQELYGTPGSSGKEFVKLPPPRPPTRDPSLNVPKICIDSKIDAITMNSDGFTYIFKDTQYYRLDSYGIAEGYPREIEEDWKGITGPIDSALHWDNGYTYLFKGDYYWKFYNFNLIYVRSIEEGFKGIPGNINAAFVWGGNGKTYFIKGDLYWRYTVNHVDPGYPKPMSVWVGLPSHIDAALKWKNGRTYFFSGNLYYRYNDVDFNIDTSYPRTTSNWWLGCTHEEQMNLVVRNGEVSITSVQPNEPEQVPASTPGSESQGEVIDVGPHTEEDTKEEEFLQVDEEDSSADVGFYHSNTNSAANINITVVLLIITFIIRLLSHVRS